ncbi:MAG: flavodoxin family protein [Selenomonas sp.]|nr:flavodoxin family protein [Selenomonas sp.]
MSKKVVIISASLRKNSNSEALATAFADGAREAGHEVEQISLRDKTINFCKGCLACQKTMQCVIKDDANEITAKIGQADVVALATPVYYYGMCGQLKTLLDRANPLFPSDYRFREVYLLAVAAEDEESTVAGTRVGVQGWVDCFDKAELKETIFCGGVTNIGDIAGNAALEKARQAGKNI